MTALNGLLDGETAAALRGLYGVQEGAEATSSQPEEEVGDWSDYGDAEESSYCDNCGEELLEDELPLDSKAEETLCTDCERRASAHALERFISTRSRSHELDD